MSTCLIYKLIDCTYYNIGNDVILFSEDLKKILLLNETAYSIWNILQSNVINGLGEITKRNIMDSLLEVFRIDEINSSTVMNDIEQTLDSFIREGLMVLEKG